MASEIGLQYPVRALVILRRSNDSEHANRSSHLHNRVQLTARSYPYLVRLHHPITADKTGGLNAQAQIVARHPLTHLTSHRKFEYAPVGLT